MSVLKQSGTQDHLSVALITSRTLSRRPLADKADPFKIASERTRAEESRFAEDFTMEHSFRGRQISSVQMVGNF
jgi:hypothetical protein